MLDSVWHKSQKIRIMTDGLVLLRGKIILCIMAAVILSVRGPNMLKQLAMFCGVTVLILSCGISMAGQMHSQGGHEQLAEAPVGTSHADVEKHKGCRHCGMDRGKFAHSRMLITYSDGSVVGVCSIHCTVTELKASKGKTVKTVEVADYNTKKLVGAEKAIWVIGGSKKGVMTRTAKWAFAEKDAAAAFVKVNGGALATYREAQASAEKD